MSEQIIKKMPFSLEAEQSVLGSVLIDPEKFSSISTLITGEDFYLEEHRQIYYAMQELFLQSHKIDLVTLLEALVHQGVYDETRCKAYVREIAETVPSAANIVDYAKIVKEKSILRRLIDASEDISNIAYEAKEDIEHIIDSAEQKIYAIAEGNESKNFVHIKDVLLETYDRLHRLNEDQGDYQGVATGFSGLDRVLVGLGKMDLVLVGARPGMGKTTLAMNIASNVAKSSKKAVCIFTLEMSNEQVVSRLLSSEALIDSYKMRTGNLTDNEWTELAHAAARLSECEIYFDDSTNVTITSMKSKLRRVKNLGLVVVDYLGLMQSDRQSDRRALEISEISRNLKKLAREFEVPVLVCAQLNRESVSKSRRPALHDLRDSGAIEQDADIVLFVYREDDYDGGENEPQNQAEIIIAKNRHGSTGMVKLNFLGQYTKFSTCEDLPDAP